MPLEILITVDYELFGDGSGTVYNQQISPTRYLLDVLNEYGAKLTVFFEFGQYKFFEKNSGLKDNFSESNYLIREQLKGLVEEGHDVQLHFHPTWNAAVCNDEIRLDVKNYDISTFDSESIVNLLREGKFFLEKLLNPINKKYRCIAFRSGALSVSQPGKYLRALVEAGFLCDSSVSPNARFKSTYGCFDYRNSPSDFGYWWLNPNLNSLLVASNKTDVGLIELPIYTLSSPLAFLKYLNGHYLRVNRVVKYFYPMKISDKNLSFLQKISKYFGRNYYMADINNFGSRELKRMLERALKSSKEDEVVPVVLIGHSKSTYFADELRAFLQYVRAHPDLEFSTVLNVVDRIYEN